MGDPWTRFKENFLLYKEIDMEIDISKMNFDKNFFESMEDKINRAFEEMDELEGGAIANPDEGRMVGHYWLRNPEIAPKNEIKNEINNTLTDIKLFVDKIVKGDIRSQTGKKFKNYLLIGIGGSALGPQFVADSLKSDKDLIQPYFIDNTDPDGIDFILNKLGDDIDSTLAIVISKSGGTIETRNGLIEAESFYNKKGLDFSHHAVAVTQNGSKLFKKAKDNKWIEIFPMWDWVGGRTSLMSAVGLLPAALQGIDIDELLKGARTCDKITRKKEAKLNPAAVLSLMWYSGTEGKGSKDMVILPYKDRLSLFTKYLQQLIMESLGKEKDRKGNIVNQGISVYGNKGSTDQHAYIQQLREGVNNFFVTFIEVLKDREGNSRFVEENITSGDYLNHFLLATKKALYDNNRESITITIEKISPFSVGALIALYERAVGFYASMINVNAYNQPGVEAGKKAAGMLVKIQKELIELLKNEKAKIDLNTISEKLALETEKEFVFKILENISANSQHKIKKIKGKTVLNDLYFYQE